MSWHNFQPDSQYELNEVLDACEKRIRDGKVIDLEGKKKLIELIGKYSPSVLVWTPSGTGWGSSPFNPSCWRTTDGKKILPNDVAVPDLLEDNDA